MIYKILNNIESSPDWSWHVISKIQSGLGTLKGMNASESKGLVE